MLVRRLALALLALVVAPRFAAADGATTRPVATGVVFHDRNGNGTRDAGEEGIPDVRVSNQREVVRTDAQGRWQLPAGDDVTFFVVKPRNWMTPVDKERQLPRFYYTHKPAGSPPLRFEGVKPTGPLPASIDFPLRPQQEPDTFKAIFFADTQPRDVKEVDYMARDVIADLVGTDANFGVTLGDIVFDDLSVFDCHNRTVALVGIPWYNVIGNHDSNQDAADDRFSDETYERHFGPNYYSFDYGPVHFIALDDIAWTPAKDGKNAGYDAAFGEAQIEFVRNDLALVPDDQLVLLMMHIPLPGVRDRQAVYRLIEKRPYVLSISGHTHWQGHTYIDADDGWRGREPHHHVINVTVCGSWWEGAPDELGIPHATMRDGAPNGYSIITFDGHRATIDYRAARKPASYQMNIYGPRLTDDASDKAPEVVVNFFSGCERSTVQMRLGADGPWTDMKRVVRVDPAIADIIKAQDSPHPPRGRKMESIECRHLWAAEIPSDAPRGIQLVHVRATDGSGRTFEACQAIRVK